MIRTRFFAALAALAAAACALPPVNRAGEGVPPTVEFVDLQRYQGLWYEIARFPNSFQRGCTAVTAQYKLTDDDRVRVVNTCRKGAVDGPVNDITGSARAVDGSGNARLRVRFVPEWVPFAEGDYWVFDLADDYSHALVGTPSGRYLWILARTPTLPDGQLAAVKQRAADLGFNISALEMTPQPPQNLPTPLE